MCRGKTKEMYHGYLQNTFYRKFYNVIFRTYNIETLLSGIEQRYKQKALLRIRVSQLIESEAKTVKAWFNFSFAGSQTTAGESRQLSLLKHSPRAWLKKEGSIKRQDIYQLNQLKKNNACICFNLIFVVDISLIHSVVLTNLYVILLFIISLPLDLGCTCNYLALFKHDICNNVFSALMTQCLKTELMTQLLIIE